MVIACFCFFPFLYGWLLLLAWCRGIGASRLASLQGSIKLKSRGERGTYICTHHSTGPHRPYWKKHSRAIANRFLPWHGSCLPCYYCSTRPNQTFDLAVVWKQMLPLLLHLRRRDNAALCCRCRPSDRSPELSSWHDEHRAALAHPKHIHGPICSPYSSLLPKDAHDTFTHAHRHLKHICGRGHTSLPARRPTNQSINPITQS